MADTVRLPHDVFCPRCDQEITVEVLHSFNDEDPLELCDDWCPLCLTDFNAPTDPYHHPRGPKWSDVVLEVIANRHWDVSDRDPRDDVPGAEG